MNLPFFSTLAASPSQTKEPSEITALFTFLNNQITRQDLASDIWKQYKAASALPQEKQPEAYAHSYRLLEEFIVSNKPGIVKQVYTREALRLEITKTIHTDALPDTLKIFFLPPLKAEFLFFTIIAHPLLEQLIHEAGEQAVRTIITEECTALSLPPLPLHDSWFDTQNLTFLDTLTVDTLRKNLTMVFRRLYRELENKLGTPQGEKTAKIISDMVTDAYTAEWNSLFFDYIPENVLHVERFSQLSREDLAKRVAEETKIKQQKSVESEHLGKQLTQKVNELESQYSQMEETKRALINILEDARELEAQVKTERDRLQTIISSVGEGLAVVDHNYRIVLLNPVAEKLLEIPFAEAKGQQWDVLVQVFIGDRELAVDERPLKKVFDTGAPVQGTIDDNYFFQSKSGKRFPIALSYSPLSSGEEVNGAVMVFRDITHEKEEKTIIEKTVEERTSELKAKNDALEKAQMEISQGWLQAQREKARLTASINSLPIGFVLTDKDNAVFMINSATKQILNITSDVFHADVLESFFGKGCKLSELLKQTKETKGIVRQNDILVGTNYINIMVVPILLETGNEFLGSAIVVEDITERKIIDRSRDEFFSIASHELRTPLTAIRGNTSMILQYYSDKIKNDKELMEMIQDIHSSSVRLIQIVNDFLTVSRLEMKKLTFKKEVVDLKELVEKTSKEAEATAVEKHVAMVTHIQSDISRVMADPDRVKEVLLNLLGNAIKYTEHGSVTTDVTQKDGFITIAVIDSGIGIPKERWDLLFRKFQQAGENIYTRDTSRSTGMGLYISKLMVEGMGGKIWLERSEPGVGSTFTFTLPVVSGASTSPVTSPS